VRVVARELRNHHIKRIRNARVDKVSAEDGSVKQEHELPQVFTMMLPTL
jgi:sulfide:quinone oxidoreductase